MNPEILRMLLGEAPSPMRIGRTSSVVRKTLAAQSLGVWLSRETLCKQLVKHPELRITDYENLDWALAAEHIIRDRDLNRLHVLAGRRGVKPSTLKLTIKSTENSERLFLISAHWVRPRTIRRLTARAPDVPLKW